MSGYHYSCLLYVAVQLLLPLPVGNKNIEVGIPKGATFRQAVEIFSKEKIIRNKTLFLIIGRITGIDRKIRAGYYSIYSSMNTARSPESPEKGTDY